MLLNLSSHFLLCFFNGNYFCFNLLIFFTRNSTSVLPHWLTSQVEQISIKVVLKLKHSWCINKNELGSSPEYYLPPVMENSFNAVPQVEFIYWNLMDYSHNLWHWVCLFNLFSFFSPRLFPSWVLEMLLLLFLWATDHVSCANESVLHQYKAVPGEWIILDQRGFHWTATAAVSSTD